VKLRWSTGDQASLTDRGTIPEVRSPSIFSAVQEQLGLRLEADKGPVEVLVIESANKTPKEN